MQTFATYTGATGVIAIIVSFINVACNVFGYPLGKPGMFMLTFFSTVAVNAFGLASAYSGSAVKKLVGWEWLTPIFLAVVNTFQMTLAVLGGSAVLNSITSAATPTATPSPTP
jgi:peptidoglycan biosynthesis protein MviN/MurJ (putative lipid II flippase)